MFSKKKDRFQTTERKRLESIAIRLRAMRIRRIIQHISILICV